MKKLNLLICVFLFLLSGTAIAQYTDVVDFTGTSGAYIGSNPVGALTLSGSLFYGTTASGGVNGEGNIFSYDPVTNVYTDLVDFTGLSVGHLGSYPRGGLVLFGGVLYGLATNEGMYGYGVLFSYNPATNVYTDLADFSGTAGAAPGAYPEGYLTLSGGILYGMTSDGSTNGYGSIFSFNPVGNVFTNLYSFAHNERPTGSLTLSGSILYGMTPVGGAGNGNIFSFNPVGNVYTDLLDFTGASGAAIGKNPAGSLTLAGGLLYGTTLNVSNYSGNIFSYDPVANVYTNLVNLTNTGGAYPGSEPIGTLTLSGGVLYGMTGIGGIGNGVLFSYDTATGTYTDLHNFVSGTGVHPGSSITFFGGVLYGTATGGGANNKGVIFSFNPPCSITYHDTITAQTCTSQLYAFNGKNYNTSGLYNDTLTNTGGCDSIVTLALTVDSLPTVTWGGGTDTAISTAGNITLTGGQPAGGIYSGAGVNGSTFNPVAAGAGVHVITYYYTNGGNCTDSASKTFVVVVSGINEVSLTEQISLYPNPANGSFVVETTATEKQLLQVFDITGKLMLAQNIQNSQTIIDAGNLTSGIYIVSLKGNGDTINKKLVISK